MDSKTHPSGHQCAHRLFLFELVDAGAVRWTGTRSGRISPVLARAIIGSDGWKQLEASGRLEVWLDLEDEHLEAVGKGWLAEE